MQAEQRQPPREAQFEPRQEYRQPEPRPAFNEGRRNRRREPEQSDVPRIDAPQEPGPAEVPQAEAVSGSGAIRDKSDLMKELESLGNTLKARFYNIGFERVAEVPVRDVIKSLGDSKDVHAIVFDGIITQRLADLASKQGVKLLIGLKIGNVNKVPDNIEIITKGK